LLAFFFQAGDGIRDFHVTGVQTCALPICPFPGTALPVPIARPRLHLFRDPRAEPRLPRRSDRATDPAVEDPRDRGGTGGHRDREIGRASGRERVESYGGYGWRTTTCAGTC